MNEVFPMGAYLRSSNGAFIATLQTDGNFVIYRANSPANKNAGHIWATDQTGQGPFFLILQGDGNLDIYRGTNPSNQHDDLWYSNKYTKNLSGPYVGILQDDGNFVIYHGTSENDHGDVWWQTGATDPIVMMDNITKLNYDEMHKKVVRESPVTLWQEAVTNDLDRVTTSQLAGKFQNVTESHFSDSVSDKITVNNVAEFDIPLVADGTLTLTWEHVSSHSSGGSVSTTETDSFATSLPVPPHSKGMAVVLANRATVSLPYEFAGTFVYKSGARLPVNIKGIYTGTNPFNVQIHFLYPPEDPKAQVGLSQSKPIPLHFTMVNKQTIRKPSLTLRSATR